MDALSQVLKTVQLDAALFFHAEFREPCAVREPEACVMASYLAPKTGHVIIYHLFTEGSGWVQLDGGRRVPVEAGDVVVLPNGDGHVLGVGHPETVQDARREIENLLATGLTLNRFGGDGAATRIICGYLSCDAELCRILLSGLPPLLKVNIRDDASGQWLENTIRYSLEHLTSSGPGAEGVLAKLSEVLFVEILRRYVQRMPAEETGWLAGARDPEVGKALSLMHRHATRRWTIADLASEVGLCRAVLAERFRRYLGTSPMAYLTNWRLRLAAQMLANSSESVAQIAVRSAYDSEASFNRAFKRVVGVPPAQFRREARARAGQGELAEAVVGAG